MTIGDIAKKDYYKVYVRVISNINGCEYDLFYGVFKTIDGKIYALDGERYSKDELIISFEEFTDKKGNECCVIYI